MKKEKVYVVNVQFYGDWSWECGSNDIVGIYSNLESALQVFRKTIEHELFEDFFHLEPHTNLKSFHQDLHLSHAQVA